MDAALKVLMIDAYIELQALCSEWIVEKAMDDWVVSKIICCTIILSWTMAEMKPLVMFHKNRVFPIRRGTPTEALYRVRTSVFAADIGTTHPKKGVHKGCNAWLCLPQRV